jgi:hypothetical protein
MTQDDEGSHQDLPELVASVRKFVVKLLQRVRSSERAHQVAKSAAQLAQAALKLHREKRPPKRTVGCRAGCGYCCSLQVHVTAPEVLRIVDHLRATYSPDALNKVVDRVTEVDDKTRGLDSIERFYSRISCPFVINDACSIYEVRPLACQGYTSYSWLACARSSRTGLQNRPVPLGGAQVDIYGAAFEGVLAGLDAVGLRPQTLELIAAVRIALSEADATTSWFEGAPVFDAAVLPYHKDLGVTLS